MRNLVKIEKIEASILMIQNHKVILDTVLAELYGVSLKVLNQQVKRNLKRFPSDFMFQLTYKESIEVRSLLAPSDQKHGGRRKLPYAFTEQGVAMLSGVLNSDRAIAVNIEIMRAFVRLKNILATHKVLAEKLEQLEKKVIGHDENIKAVFEAIRQLMEIPSKKKKVIGFR